MRVALFVTCMVDVLEPDVGVATVRVLRAAGCDVSCPDGQTCCGQPAWNAGAADAAATVARTTLDALHAALHDPADPAEVVVVPAGSCATMIRVFWPELFELVGDHDAAERARLVGARTRELSELLAERSLPPLRMPATRVAYHHSCHLLRELRVHDQPEALLDRVEGCERVEWGAAERCCGFGGLFSMKLPEVSVAMADDKLASLAEAGAGAGAGAGAELLVSADGSCLLHLRTRAEHEGRPVRTAHLAQVLAAALDGRDPRVAP
ncbi:MAG: (Fe-S)-binding protein [Acidimicrobiales bacterium]|nr:(Fe-S)-binding protein [Acidimicrobiales bacterium]